MRVRDAATIEAAKAELTVVRNGLGMFQAESDVSAYPPSSAITRYDELYAVLSPYIAMPEMQDAAWSFVSYVSARPDTFVLRGMAKDSNNILMTVTSVVIKP